MTQLVLVTGGTYSEFGVHGLFRVDEVELKKRLDEVAALDMDAHDKSFARHGWSKVNALPEGEAKRKAYIEAKQSLSQAQARLRDWFETQEAVDYQEVWTG